MSGPGISAEFHLRVAKKVLPKESARASLSDGDTRNYPGMEADLTFSEEV